MRLYSTLSRRKKDELPPPPGPIGIYTCGPTVYQRIHIGNARPFVLSMWLRSLARAPGLRGDARREHHRHQRQDLRRRARSRAPSSRRRRPNGIGRTPTCSGSAAPTSSRRRPRRIPEIVALIEELIRDGYAYAAGGDVYFRVGRYPEYGALSGQRPDQVQEQEDEANPLKEDPRDFALWKAQQAGRGHVVGVAVGPRPPGLAHRVLGDGREVPRADPFEHPHRRARPRVPAPRERAGAVAGGGARVRAHLDAQRDARADRREDVEVDRQHRDPPRRRRAVGPRDGAPLLPDRALAQADRLLRRDDGAGGSPGRDVSQRLPRRASGPAANGRRSRRRWTTTSTRRPRSRSCTSGGGRGTSRRCGRPRGLRPRLARRGGDARLPRLVELAERRQQAREAGDFAEADRLRRGDRGGRLGGARRTGRLQARPDSEPRPRLRPPRRPRGAARAAGGARALGDRAGRRRASPGSPRRRYAFR